MTSGRLVLRATVGAIMMGHGLQKLQGSFGGPGIEGTTQMMESLGLHPARQQATVAGLTETVGGGLTAAGLFFPLGPAMITGLHAVAINKVHWKNGPWVTQGGFEYNVALIAASLALASSGPGPFSLDAIRGKQHSGLGWGILAGLLGFGAAAATLQAAEKMKPQAGGEASAAASASTASVTPAETSGTVAPMEENETLVGEPPASGIE